MSILKDFRKAQRMSPAFNVGDKVLVDIGVMAEGFIKQIYTFDDGANGGRWEYGITLNKSSPLFFTRLANEIKRVPDFAYAEPRTPQFFIGDVFRRPNYKGLWRVHKIRLSLAFQEEIEYVLKEEKGESFYWITTEQSLIGCQVDNRDIGGEMVIA